MYLIKEKTTCTCTHMCVYKHLHICADTHMHLYTHMYLSYMHLYTHIVPITHARTCTDTCMHLYTHIYVHAQIYTCTYIHRYTYVPITRADIYTDTHTLLPKMMVVEVVSCCDLYIAKFFWLSLLKPQLHCYCWRTQMRTFLDKVTQNLLCSHNP